MRVIKISFLFAMLAGFSSCLKSKNDVAGTRNDSGNIVISIAETEYIDQDDHAIGSFYAPFANFDFTTPATESIQFFSVHIAQPREKKISGSLKLTITASDGNIGSPLPAGAITVTPVEIPAFSGTAIDVPVKFTVNKAGLDPDGYYSVLFRITNADQGIISENAREVEVLLHNGKYYGRFIVETTVTDPLGYLKITKNTKPVLLDNLSYVAAYPTSYVNPSFSPYASLVPDQNYLVFFDEYFHEFANFTTSAPQSLGLLVDNLTTGTTATRYVLLSPTYHVNASGTVDAVYNSLNGTNYNVTFTNQLSNKYVITENGKRTLEVSYDVTLTAPTAGGTTASRTFHIEEKYTYHPIQVRIWW